MVIYELLKPCEAYSNQPTTANDNDLMINLDDIIVLITTDITYIQLTDKTCVYMGRAYNLEDRKVLSYRVADTMTAQLVTSVIVRALRRVKNHCMCIAIWEASIPVNCLKMHWSPQVLGTLTPLKGAPYDNARIESFHSLLKREMIYQRDFESIADVQAAVDWYVNWYNNNRISLRDAT